MQEKLHTLAVKLPDDFDITELFGNLDTNIKLVEHATSTSIILRENKLLIKGDDPEVAGRIIYRLIESRNLNRKLDRQRVSYLIDSETKGNSFDEKLVDKDIICYTHHGKPLRPKTLGQKQYVDRIRNNDMVFGIGPAGTGKTYLACAMAVTAFKNKEVARIILTRPAVETGERLGFLPGDMQEKVDPYLRPLYDALFDIMGQEAATKLREKNIVEVVPLAYMRGRTLDNSFIILDEAQNTTREQMKMFLTRMGMDSKVIVTGDVTQIDLPKGVMSGLVEASKALKNVEGITFSFFTEADVVRHELVKRIIVAYNEYDKTKRINKA